MKNGGSFHSKLLVYQRVNLHFPSFSYGFPMVFPLKPPFLGKKNLTFPGGEVKQLRRMARVTMAPAAWRRDGKVPGSFTGKAWVGSWLPSGKHIQKTMERSTIFHGKLHYFYGPCSIAMLNYQRVTSVICPKKDFYTSRNLVM